MTRAMLLCAGFGTRLGALSDDRPKPALPVCNLPIIRYGVALLVGHGIRDIGINLHHKGDAIRNALGDGSHLGARIRYFEEDPILETGGALKNALPFLDMDGTDEAFISLNGKLIFDLDLHAVLAAFAQMPAEVLGMMVVRPAADAVAWGAVDVQVDEAGRYPRVRNILGTGGFMFSGVHVTRPSAIRRLPDGPACMVRQGYLPWLQGGQAVSAYVADDRAYFAEHSTPERYLASNLALLSGAELRFPPAPLRGIDPSARIADGATVLPPVCIGAGAEIAAGAVVGPSVVVGERAEIAAGAQVERAVIWPDTRVGMGMYKGSILTPSAVVPAE